MKLHMCSILSHQIDNCEKTNIIKLRKIWNVWINKIIIYWEGWPITHSGQTKLNNM